MTNRSSPGSLPTDPTQSLPQDEDLEVNQSPETPAEKLKRLEREAELNKAPPEPPTNIGPDTTGVGQPSSQPLNQGQSLPPSAVPVEKNFEGQANQFYDPAGTERAVNKKDRADRGGQKTDI